VTSRRDILPGPRQTISGLLLALAVVICAAGCREPRTAGRQDETARPIIAVTIFPIGDITATLAASDAEVVVILPAGANPATFEPAPDIVRRLAGARLVVAVGAGADDWGSDLAHTWGANLLVLTRSMTLEYENNPHVWLDPVLVRDAILPQLTRATIRVIPEKEAAIRTRAAAYHKLLTALDQDIRTALSVVESRAFVATHAAWPYFAERYDLRQIGVLYPVPGRELGPREFATLVDQARRARVQAVFTEPQLGATGAKALAEDLGARIGTLDPLGGSAVADRNSYEALLRYNARELARTLGAAQ
jgi:zinc transport system substrate-binding protein